jgi:D-sedoheptulose 7-phosphate isomerase
MAEYEKQTNHRSMGVMDWLNELNNAVLSTKCRINLQEEPLDRAIETVTCMFERAESENASIFWAGNGGSAAICSHLSQDVLNRLGIRSIYMGDSALMSCMANDFGYENVYSRPLERFMRRNDILIAISSSGNSENIVSCVEVAGQKGVHVITLSGMKDDNRLFNSRCRVSFLIESELYGIVETGHEALLHAIIETAWLNTCNIKNT